MLDKISNGFSDPKKYYLSSSNGALNDKPKINQPPKDLSLSKKAVILGSSALGMTPVLAFLAHKNGFSLNPSKILKTPIKDWALFKYKPLEKTIKFDDEAEIISLASASVLGGFVGGALVDDKSNLKAKKREVLNQLLGDVAVPILCVGLGARVYNKYSAKLIKMTSEILNKPKLAKNIKPEISEKISNVLPSAFATLSSLAVGIVAGNKVSNFINEKLYHKKVERGIKPSDFAPHVDDLCLATSMVNKTSEFASKIARVVPLALMVPGYETGTAQEK